MALLSDQKFSTFNNGGDLEIGDTVVGLRGGINTKFLYTGEILPGIVVPIISGGTGATTATQARINLGLGTMAVQDANAVNITGGVALLTSGSVAATPVAPNDLVNKIYVDSLVSGSVLTVSGTANRITSTGGSNPVIDIAATYVGQTSITTLGTVVTGVWNATPIDLALYVSGNLAVTHLNSGTAASNTTFWRGDGTWSTPASGTYTGTTNQINVVGTVISLADNLIMPGDDGFVPPQGSIGARPAAGVFGRIRSNTSICPLECDDGSTWQYIPLISETGTSRSVMVLAGTNSYQLVGSAMQVDTSGNVTGATWTANPIDLSLYVTGDLAVSHLNGGTGASNSTFWRGDGTWASPTGSGTVNSGLINQVAWYAANGTAVSGLTTANSGVLVTSGAGVPSISTTLPNINIGTPTAGVLTNTTAGGGVRSFQVFTSGTGLTYTKPANVTSILVEVVGGGGGGGGGLGGVSTSGVAAGGGSGGYAQLYIASAAGSYTYTVGGGGAGGAAGNNTGSTGGTTTFGATLQATGGTGGRGASAVANASGSVFLGGTGGVGTNGNINSAGQPGMQGTFIFGVGSSGAGGCSHYGGGANGLTTSGTGTTATGYGGGGSGAIAGASSTAGGVGAAGLIVVWEFS